MNILIKTTIVIALVACFVGAFILGMEREAHRQEVVNRDICVKYKLECRG